MDENHCVDCCCAQSWKALGITQYTGKSIPEHIAALAASHEKLVQALKAFKDHESSIAPDMSWNELEAMVDASLAEAEKLTK